ATNPEREKKREEKITETADKGAAGSVIPAARLERPLLNPPSSFMASSASTILCLSIFLTLNSSSIGFVHSSSCRPRSIPFLYDLRFQCPLSISHPIQMNEEALERALSSKPKNSYSALLFYGAWCSFSSSIRGKFDILSSMYPQIGHIEVEESSATPSLLSRFGVRSLPAVLIINQTTYVRYYGKKDLHSLARFYHKATGLDPVKDLLPSSSSGWKTDNENDRSLWYQASSWKEMFENEPYLLISISFLILRIFLHLSPQLLRGFAALWNTCRQHLNMGVFGESRQLLGRAMQIIDVKRAMEKLKWCKTRSFHRGARSARVWASSLASVSLGESGSA
ncbi:hypothetical protein V2J09_022719, partial [Rumex salicifolius]